MMGPINVTVTGSVAASTVVAMDYLVAGVTAIQTVASSTASVYNIEWTLGRSTDPTGSTLAWFSSGSSALTGNAYLAFTHPAQGIRLNVTSGTSLSVVNMTIIQSG